MAQDGPGRVREAAGAAPHGAARGPGSGPPSVRRVSVSLRRAWAPHGGAGHTPDPSRWPGFSAV